MRRLKFSLGRNDGGVWGDDFDSEGTVVLRSTEQTVGGGWNIVEPARRSLSATERAAGLLATDDLLITKSSGSELHIGKTSIVTEEVASLQCCFSNFMQRLRCSHGLLPKLVFYVLNSPIGREQFVYGSNTTTGLANLNGHVIGNLVLAVPPLDEQRAIAAFLDRETARIDALIAKKQRLIELLAEKRRAIVDDVLVTKRRSSWTTERLKFSSTFVTSGSRGWAEYYSDDGPVFIRIGNLTRDSIDLDLSDIQRVTPPAGAEGERTRARAGDVLFSVTAYIGSIAVVPPDLDEAYVNQHTALVRLKPNTLNPRLLAYSLFSRFGQEQFRASLYGGTKDGLSLVDVRDLLIIKPPRTEQDALVATLDAALRKHTGVSTTIHVAIERLREYRSTLISAAVTGKIDVRCNPKEACS